MLQLFHSLGMIPSNPLFKHLIRAPLLFIYVLFQSTPSKRVNKRIPWFFFFHEVLFSVNYTAKCEPDSDILQNGDCIDSDDFLVIFV